jgi:hypothetical protein
VTRSPWWIGSGPSLISTRSLRNNSGFQPDSGLGYLRHVLSLSRTVREAAQRGFGVLWGNDLDRCHRELTSGRVNPDWLTSGGGRVETVARGIHERLEFDGLPILADALEEAGCDDPVLLTHCREPGEHVDCCWVTDMILGRWVFS